MLFNVMNIKYQETLAKRNKLSYESDLIARIHESITEKITSIESQVSSKSSLTNNSAYQELVASADAYDIKQDSIDTELKYLEQEMQSFKDQLSKGAESRKWTCFG